MSPFPVVAAFASRYVSAFHAASSIAMIHETSLGLTLMILTVIATQEINHLVHSSAALVVMGTACLSVLAAYRT